MLTTYGKLRSVFSSFGYNMKCNQISAILGFQRLCKWSPFVKSDSFLDSRQFLVVALNAFKIINFLTLSTLSTYQHLTFNMKTWSDYEIKVDIGSSYKGLVIF